MKNINELKENIYDSEFNNLVKSELIDIIDAFEKSVEDLVDQSTVNKEDIELIRKEIKECKDNVKTINKLLKDEKLSEAKAKISITKIRPKRVKSIVSNVKGDLSSTALKAIRNMVCSFVVTTAILTASLNAISKPNRKVDLETGEETKTSKNNRNAVTKANLANASAISTIPTIRVGINELRNANWKKSVNDEIDSVLKYLTEIEKYFSK